MKKLGIILPAIFCVTFMSSCQKCQDCTCSQTISETGMPDVNQSITIEGVCDDEIDNVRGTTNYTQLSVTGGTASVTQNCDCNWVYLDKIKEGQYSLTLFYFQHLDPSFSSWNHRFVRLIKNISHKCIYCFIGTVYYNSCYDAASLRPVFEPLNFKVPPHLLFPWKNHFSLSYSVYLAIGLSATINDD